MAYLKKTVTLDLDSDLSHHCSVHATRDGHLIGIIEFKKTSEGLTWGDMEYFRRRTEEFSVMPFPECINAMIIDIREVEPFLDNEVPILPWRLMEEECPVRLVVTADRLQHYVGFFEPTWLCHDIETAIAEIREYMDMFVH